MHGSNRDRRARWRERGSRLLGWSWGAAWLCLLGVVSAPWDALGGVVDERVRWLARFVPASAVIVGCWVGSFARSAQGAGRVYLRGLRCWLGPPAVIVAGVLIVLRVAGREDAIGLVVAGFLGYWAGIDLGLAIWPRICGRSDPAIGPDRRDDRFDRWFPI